MKKLGTGIVIAASLVALTACKKTEAPNATEAAAPTEAMVENNAEAPMANATGNMVDSTSGEGNAAMVGDAMATNNSTDEHGSSGGH